MMFGNKPQFYDQIVKFRIFEGKLWNSRMVEL